MRLARSSRTASELSRAGTAIAAIVLLAGCTSTEPSRAGPAPTPTPAALHLHATEPEATHPRRLSLVLGGSDGEGVGSFVVTGRGLVSGAAAYVITLGDGTRREHRLRADCADPVSTGFDDSFFHRYERAGSYDVVLTVVPDTCGPDPVPRPERASLTVIAGPQLPEPKGLSVRFDVEPVPDQPRTVRVVVRVRDDNGGGPGYALAFGDGRREELALAVAACPATASPPPPARLDRTLVFRHTYARRGSYEVRLDLVSRHLCGSVPDENHREVRDVTVG